MVQIYTKIANTTQNYIFFLLRFLPQKLLSVIIN